MDENQGSQAGSSPAFAGKTTPPPNKKVQVVISTGAKPRSLTHNYVLGAKHIFFEDDSSQFTSPAAPAQAPILATSTSPGGRSPSPTTSTADRSQRNALQSEVTLE